MSITAHLWESTICAGAAALLVFALRNAPARVRHAVWLCASLKFLVPFPAVTALGRWFGTRVLPDDIAAFALAVRWLDDSLPRAVFHVAAVPPAFVFPMRVHDTATAVLIAVWLLGSMALVVWRYRQWRDLSCVARRAAPLRHGRVAAALARVQARTGTWHALTLRQCDSTLEPAVGGLRHPVLLWPRGLAERLTAHELESILAHELCHARRRDNLRALAHVLVECLFWFHPVVWWIGARLVSERERACDEEVLQMGARKQTYAEAILEVCRHSLRAPVAFAATVGGSDLARRVARIMDGRALPYMTTRTRLLLGSALVAAVIAPLGIGVVSAHRTHPYPAGALDPAPVSQDRRDVHRPGDDVSWPKLVHEVKPSYTPEAMQAGIQGRMLLEVLILEDGTVDQVEVVESLDTDYGLDEQAVTALEQWLFTPALKDGKAVPVVVPVEVSFTLK